MFEQHGGLGEVGQAFVQVFHLLFELQGHQGDAALAVGGCGGFGGVEQAQGNAAVFLLLQAEAAGELLFAAGELDFFGQFADIPVGEVVALEVAAVVAKVTAAAWPSWFCSSIRSRAMASSWPPSSITRMLK